VQPRQRGVVPLDHPGRRTRRLAGQRGAGERDRPRHALQRLARHPPQPQQHGARAGEVHHRRLDPDRGGPPVEDDVDRGAQLGHDVRRRGGRDAGEGVGAGGGDGDPRALDEGARHRVRRDAHADGVESGAHRIGDLAGAREDEGERPGPEGGGQGARQRRDLARDAPHLRHVGHVDDERVERGAPLGGIDPLHRPLAEGVGPQAVDRLGGEGDEPAGANDRGRLVDGGRERRRRRGRRGGRGGGLWAVRTRTIGWGGAYGRCQCKERRGRRAPPPFSIPTCADYRSPVRIRGPAHPR